MIRKIVNKSKVWWRHGKHKPIVELSGRVNAKRAPITPIDTRSSNWSGRKPR